MYKNEKGDACHNEYDGMMFEQKSRDNNSWIYQVCRQHNDVDEEHYDPDSRVDPKYSEGIYKWVKQSK